MSTSKSDYSPLPLISPEKNKQHSDSFELTDLAAIIPHQNSTSSNFHQLPTIASAPIIQRTGINNSSRPFAIHPDPNFEPSAPPLPSSIMKEQETKFGEPSANNPSLMLSKRYVSLKETVKLKHFTCCFVCSSLLVVIILVVVKVFAQNSSSSSSDSSSAQMSYISTVIYSDSACSTSDAIYETAYPIDTCLVYFVSSSVTQSYQYQNDQYNAIGEPYNITANRYTDTTCTFADLSRYTISTYNQCTALTKYKGYYQMLVYSEGGYFPTVNAETSLSVTGYQDLSCRTTTEFMNVQLLTCLPVSSTSSVMYTPNAEGTLKTTYPNINCAGSVITSTLQIPSQTSCFSVTTVDTFSPFRSLPVTDAFT